MNAETVEECFESECTYIGGPYSAGTFVSYGANAYDGAGNRAWTGYKSVHISESMDIIPPTVIDQYTSRYRCPCYNGNNHYL